MRKHTYSPNAGNRVLSSEYGVKKEMTRLQLNQGGSSVEPGLDLVSNYYSVLLEVCQIEDLR